MRIQTAQVGNFSWRNIFTDCGFGSQETIRLWGLLSVLGVPCLKEWRLAHRHTELVGIKRIESFQNSWDNRPRTNTHSIIWKNFKDYWQSSGRQTATFIFLEGGAPQSPLGWLWRMTEKEVCPGGCGKGQWGQCARGCSHRTHLGSAAEHALICDPAACAAWDCRPAVDKWLLCASHSWIP